MVNKYKIGDVEWNIPKNKPTVPGEYRSSIEPNSYDGKSVRYWNGVKWSNPYNDASDNAHKEFSLKNESPILPYWLDN